jgi:hypothetical protein
MSPAAREPSLSKARPELVEADDPERAGSARGHSSATSRRACVTLRARARGPLRPLEDLVDAPAHDLLRPNGGRGKRGTEIGSKPLKTNDPAKLPISQDQGFQRLTAPGRSLFLSFGERLLSFRRENAPPNPAADRWRNQGCLSALRSPESHDVRAVAEHAGGTLSGLIWPNSPAPYSMSGEQRPYSAEPDRNRAAVGGRIENGAASA